MGTACYRSRGGRGRAERDSVPLVRRRRGRAHRARPLRRGIRLVRPDDEARSRARRVHTCLLRARATGPSALGARADARRRERGRRRARASGMGSRPARKALLDDGPDRPGGEAVPARACRLPELRVRARRARARARGARTPPGRDPPRAARRGSHPTSAVRLDARRPVSQRGEPNGRAPANTR